MNKSRIKMIATDYDHTLTNEDRTVPEEVVKVLGQFVQKGGILLIASGRAPNSLQQAVNKLPFQMWISPSNGSILRKKDGTGILINEYLDISIVHKAMEIVGNLGFPHLFYDNEAYSVLESPETRMYATALGIEINQVDNISNYVKEGLRSLIFRCSEDITHHVHALLNNEISEKAQITTSHAKLVDVIPLHAGKGRAVKALLDHLDISNEDCLGMGDSLNDLPLLNSTGKKATVSNGVYELREIADFIANEPKGAGALEILNHFL